MNAAELLAECHTRDIILHPNGGQLDIDAPAGALTDELLQRMRDAKPELLAILRSDAEALQAQREAEAEREAIQWCETGPAHEVEAALREAIDGFEKLYRGDAKQDLAAAAPRPRSAVPVAVEWPTVADRWVDYPEAGKADEVIDPPDPCPECGTLELWQTLAGNWRCLRCDPPKKSRQLMRRAAHLREGYDAFASRKETSVQRRRAISPFCGSSGENLTSNTTRPSPKGKTMQRTLFDPKQPAQRLTQPLKRHGGKHYLGKRIVEFMPPHLHYVEPYFGGGSVLLARDPGRDWYHGAPDWASKSWQRGCSEVVNDLEHELMNFWSVLRSESMFEQFQRMVEATPLDQSVWAVAESSQSAGDPVVRAFHFFVRSRQSRQGIGRDFATLSRNRTRGGRNEQANAWISCIDGLRAIHERLRSVVILCDDAIKVIQSQDGDRTLFYCDPPYLHTTRSSTGEYAHEMTEEQHRQLLTVLASIKGKFILSGYHSSMYDAWAEQHGFRCEEIEIDNKASGAKTKEKKVECLWMNH